MASPDQSSTKAAPPTKPCACCGEVSHENQPDRDLDGYTCRACKNHLYVAAKVLAGAKITGCVPHPHEPR